MRGLIRFSLGNPRAITVLILTIVIGGAVSLALIPADILPVYRSPAVQVLTFYSGMPATSVEADITSRMERWTGQAAGTRAPGIALDRRRQHHSQLLRFGRQTRVLP